MTPMTFSVIIPTLNEQGTIHSCIRAVRAAAADAEIIVVDGGSVDATVKIVREDGVTLYSAERGRGAQLNVGASVSTGEILVFLHADTLVATDFFDVLRKSFENSVVTIGTCVLRFDIHHPVLRFYEACAQVKSVFTTFGDQCIVVRRSFFEMLGGFPDWPLFEDVQLLRNARVNTRIHTLPTVVVTSSRKFVEHGFIRQQVRNAMLMALYLAGTSADRLASRYAQRAGAKHHDIGSVNRECTLSTH